jgi:predicted esterase
VAPAIVTLPPVLIGRGENDQWYTESMGAADLETFARAGVQPATHVFRAGHAWDDAFRERAGQFLDSLVA